MSVKYVVIQSEPGLWTAGYFDPQDDRWISDSDHGSKVEAADRVIELNGGRSRKDRRDAFAAAALTGLLANPGRIGTLREAVEAARDAADLQIAALDKLVMP